MDRKSLSIEEESKLLVEKAEELWQGDAKEAGLQGMSIEESVIAVMFNPATATLPDPLMSPAGTKLDPDNWLVQAEAAGLFIDDTDLQILRIEEGDGSGLATVKEEPKSDNEGEAAEAVQVPEVAGEVPEVMKKPEDPKPEDPKPSTSGESRPAKRQRLVRIVFFELFSNSSN